MLRRPDVDEVIEYGRALGFDLTPTEARMIQARMMDTVAALEAFDEMRVEERRPPLRFTDRDPGGRPSEQEDPLGAFITKCRVKGADSGPLHGKTVALKDHIALAGVPTQSPRSADPGPKFLASRPRLSLSCRRG